MPLIKSARALLNSLTTASISTLLIASGCSQLPDQGDTNTSVNTAGETPVVAARPFPAETLYALLVAEIAGSRERYDIALGNYLQQAQKTRDPKVAARATHIGQYLKAHQATLNSALLWVELEPDNTEARLIAADELAASGRLLEAFEQSEALLELGSTTLFQSIAARAARATDTQREQLLSAYQRLLQNHPNNTQLIVGEGLLLQQQQQLESALASSRRALQVDGDYIPAAILEAKLLGQLERPQEALHSLTQMIERHPDNQRLRLQYARLLSEYDLNEAYQQFQILVQNNPSDPDLRMSLALISYQRGDRQEARSHFKALTQSPRHASTAYYYLGTIAEDNGEFERALSDYLAVEPGSDYMPALLHASNILVGLGRIDEAAAQLQAVRERFPDKAERFYLLEAEIYREHNHLERAENILNQGLKQLPKNTQLLYARAMLFEQREQLDSAEADLRTIIKYEPDNAAALNALGYTLADHTERYEEALNLIERALSITPDDPAVIDSMGWVQYRLGNLEAALLRLRRAMSAYPDPEIAAHLGEVLWVAGERDEAYRIWREGMALDADNSIIPATVERLTGAPLPAAADHTDDSE